MSDPMTNVDIEDVLASIRRLVSEDSRPRPAVADLVRPVAAARPQVDRLVLTPSLRIMTDGDLPPQHAGASDHDTAPLRPDPELDASARPWQDPAARLNDLWPQDAADPALVAPPDVDDDDRRSGGAADDARGEPAADVIEPVTESRADHTQDHPDVVAAASEAQSADLEATDPPPPQQHAAETFAPDAAAWHEDAPMDDVVAAPAGETQILAADDAASQEGALSWEDHHDDAPASADADDLIAPGATASDLDLIDTPHLSDPSRAHPDDIPNHDWTAAHDRSASADDVEIAEDDPTNLLAEESVIDEAMLRELVADIVRQELMGALGERITRNVRKLVRREIHRALSAQELD